MEKDVKQKNINATKPADWPHNQREARLSRVLDAVESFQKHPNYANKEVLLSLICEIDPNEHDDFGTMRICDYEIDLINVLYVHAKVMCLGALTVFLYKEITETTKKLILMSKYSEHLHCVKDLEKYTRLFPPVLKLYYLACRNYYYYKERSFCDELLATINDCETLAKQGEISLYDIENAFTNLMYELSNPSGINTIPFVKFRREELLKLFKKEFHFFEKLHKDPIECPLEGILVMTISNWILRSRNQYCHSPVFKCLTNIASNSSIENKEIWMQNVEYLNDKREGKVIKELFAKKSWINYEWAKKITLDNPYTFYVTSFSKSRPNDSLKHKYGKNVYGYRSDKIASIVSPIIKNERFTQFGQTLCFDIVYDRTIAKEELNFLFSIIDMLPLTDKSKTLFANKIINYWVLSFKDKKWEKENERRYQIFYYDQYPYFGLTKDERFLKIKSSVYLFPDNVSVDNNCYNKIKANIFERYYATATKVFIQCNACLNIDFNIFGLGDNYICPICGSTNSTKIDPNELRH